MRGTFHNIYNPKDMGELRGLKYYKQTNKQNKFIIVPQRHQRFLQIYRNNLYNYSILYIENYKIDTFSNMVHSSLLSKLFSG